VVQDWPEAGTNCRSSVQITHTPGGDSDGGYCIPQAVQMKVGMGVAYTICFLSTGDFHLTVLWQLMLGSVLTGDAQMR
jgi:hypothetical protein